MDDTTLSRESTAATGASRLDQLRDMTVVVADTGDLDAVARLRPIDCTTNPSIVLKALQSEGYAEHFDRVMRDNAGKTAQDIVDALTIEVGAELVKIVPGRVSTEVEAALSFDTEGSIAKAHGLIAAYEARGIERDRVLIKLASTWEGIRAAEQLEREGIKCNLTLIFSLAQAVACANAGAFLISPFVGRITDWYKKSTGETYAPEADPGVLSVRKIYDYYKSNGIETIVMGASFRTADQIVALAGCDRLTISPALLTELNEDARPLTRALSADQATGLAPLPMEESDFRWAMNEDAMATEKLAEGIRGFHKDTQTLLGLIEKRLG
jgi:transaldolase